MQLRLSKQAACKCAQQNAARNAMRDVTVAQCG